MGPIEQISDQTWIDILNTFSTSQPDIQDLHQTVSTTARMNCFQLLGRMMLHVVPDLSKCVENTSKLRSIIHNIIQIVQQNIKVKHGILYEGTIQVVTNVCNVFTLLSNT